MRHPEVSLPRERKGATGAKGLLQSSHRLSLRGLTAFLPFGGLRDRPY